MDTIIVCADDYAIAPGVSRAIRRLAVAGRIDATSCMSMTEFWADEGRALRASGAPIEVGLHLAMTGSGGRSLGRLARDAFAGRLDRAAVEVEIARQIDAFERVWGSPPDFIDGHQHVHQFPTVRAAVLGLWDRRLDRGRTWLRVSDARTRAILRAGTAPLKSLAIAALGRAMKRSARRAGIHTNDSLAGVYDLSARRPYGELFGRMCDAAVGRTVVMCHPGDVDAALRDADDLVDVRAVECAYFESDAYRDLRARYAGRAT